MADERVITTVFKADISNFSASTQSLNRYISQVNSEFKVATASMGKWSDTTDGLSAKITQLNKVMEAEKRKLSDMEQRYAELVAQGKENTREAQLLATAINNQSAKVKETEKNIEHYTKSLKELEEAGVDTREELEELNKQQEELKESAKALGGGILKGVGVGLVGIASACVGALAGLSGIVEETKELRTQMGQLETSFTEQGHSVEASKKTYDELYSILGDSGKVTEASLHLSQFAKNEQELEELTNSLTGAYAKFGDSLPLENIAEGVSTTLTLNQANAGMVDAIEFAGGSVEDFNAKLQSLDSEEEKRAFILQTLNESYGEAGKQYKEVNKEVIKANEVQNKYNQAMADIGEKAQPIVTQFKEAMVGVLQTILEKFNEVDISGLVGKITNAIQFLVTNVLPPTLQAITWILDNMNWLAPVLATVGGLIVTITTAIKTYNAVMKIAKAVQLAWNVVMMANPIGLVIAAIGLLVAAFVTLWNKCEGFRNFWKNLWDGIKNVASSVAETMKGIFSSIGGHIKGFVNGIIKGVNSAISWLNKIKIPDWEIFGSYAGKGINIKTVPLLAEGGVVDKPTLAMVGDAGKEAVMPLEKNTVWIDKLADKLSSKMSNQNVTYNVNNTFERMATTRLAMHKSNLELKRIIGGTR